jgi:hypothetical protein
MGQRSKTIALFIIIGVRYVTSSRKRTEMSASVPVRSRSLTAIMYAPFHFYFSVIRASNIVPAVRISQS